MKSGKVLELVDLSKPTLLKRVEDLNLDVQKTIAGEHLFRWKHIFKLKYLQMFGTMNPGSKVISICQNKGGVGKTTSVINLATGLSYLGKTLVIDLDSQANLSQSFDIYLSNEDKSLVDFLTDQDTFNDVKIEINENLHILPNNLKFEKWKKRSRLDSMTPFILKKSMKNIRNNYNFIVIDTPPALDLSLEMALYASDYCLIPIQPHSFSLDGIQNILDEIEYIASNDQIASFNLKLLGVFINLFENNNLSEVISKQIINNYPTFQTKIGKVTALAQAQAEKSPIFEYNESSNGAYDFYNLTFEILEKLYKEA
jgi:chromosome partitioning protein